MRAVIYARYSSDSQREESIEGQIRECMEFAEKNNITVIGEYIDRAISAKTDKNQKAPARHKAEDDYILTTKLRCGKCGVFMAGESGTSRTGVVHHYYKCSTAKRRKGCDKKTVRKSWIEDVVVKYTMKIVMSDELAELIADRIIAMLAQENTRIPQLQAKLKEINGYINNIMDAIQQGLFNVSAKKRLDELEASKQEIETAIFSEQLQKPEITKDHIVYWITKFRGIDINDLASRKRLIDSFVNSIYLYDDKIVFSFNYTDGTKSLTLEELESELSSDLEGQAPPKIDKFRQKLVDFYLLLLHSYLFTFFFETCRLSNR